MKKKLASKSAFFNPRVLISCALCATGVVLALAFAFATPSVSSSKGAKTALSPGVTASSSATNAVWITAPGESSITPVEERGKSDADVLTGCAWSAAAVYPIIVADSAAVTIGSNIYVFGGVSNSVNTTAANKFDGTTWTAIAALPAARQGSGIATDGISAYIINGASPVTTPSLIRYNPGSDTYTTLTAPPTGGFSSVAVFLGGKIYNICGNATGAAGGQVSTVYAYTIATDTWATVASFPVAVAFPMAVAGTGVIYAGGGLTAASTDSLTTAVYNPGTNTWNDAAIADLPATPAPAWGAASAMLNGNWVVGPGASGGFIQSNAIQWDPMTNVWSSLPGTCTGFVSTPRS